MGKDLDLPALKFDSLQALLHMDGHGVFVWAAYAITLVVLLVNVIWPMIVRKTIVQEEQQVAKRTANIERESR